MGNPTQSQFPDLPVGKFAQTDSQGNEYNDGNPFPIESIDDVSGTATLSNVNDSASSVQLLAANANRRGVTLFNDSTIAAYVNFGATASATAFTVKIASGQFYEMPAPIFTGVIHAIWESNGSGAMRITELT